MEGGKPDSNLDAYTSAHPHSYPHARPDADPNDHPHTNHPHAHPNSYPNHHRSHHPNHHLMLALMLTLLTSLPRLGRVYWCQREGGIVAAQARVQRRLDGLGGSAPACTQGLGEDCRLDNAHAREV